MKVTQIVEAILFASDAPLKAEEIARAALFLASDEADFITGVEFPVDGGRTV